MTVIEPVAARSWKAAELFGTQRALRVTFLPTAVLEFIALGMSQC